MVEDKPALTAELAGCGQSSVSVMKINPMIFSPGVNMLVQNISDPMKYWCSVNSELIP